MPQLPALRSTHVTALLVSMLFALATVTPRSAVAQSPRLPPDDPVYGDIDRLAGSGLLRTVIVGQRPFTRDEVARLVAEARDEATRARVTGHEMSRTTARALQRLQARFDSTGQRTEGTAKVELLALDSPPRRIPPAPVGSVDASVNPLLNARGGRRYAQGPNIAAELGGAWSFGNRFVVALRPRVASGGKSGERFAEGSLQEASAAVSVRNLVLDVGRQPLVWGQGLDGGLLLSASGRPLDMIRVSTIRPWRAPWVFRYLGLLRGTAFVADLGARQNFPHAKVASYKLSGAVTSYFELAALVLAHEGGRGAPKASLGERVVDLLPGLEYALPQHLGQISNKFAGIEMRARIPALHNLRLYSEHMLDDMSKLGYTTLWLDGGHIVGASLADLGTNGALAVIGEFHHTGVRYFEHIPFTSGLAFNGTLLGDPLGPQGDGAYLQLRYDAGDRQRLQFNGAIERRGGDDFVTPPEDFRFVLQTHRPAEWRHRAVLQWSLARTSRQELTVQGGVEHVRDAVFVRGATRTNALAGATWSWRAW